MAKTAGYDKSIDRIIGINQVNFKTFDLNLLRVLDALLREGSTVRAADRLGLSQPAVSAALGRLRHALDDPLFVRRGQGLIPTDRARALELPLRDVLDRAEELLGQTAFDPAQSQLTYKISGSDFFAELLMPALAAQLQRKAPGVTVQLVDLVRDNYVQTLEQYAVDMVLVPETALPDWADSQPAFTSSFAVIARKDHPRLRRAGIAPGGTIPIDLFCDLGHVLFSPEGNLRAMGDDALSAVGRERRVVMSLPVFSGVYNAVASSDLIALLPQQLAAAKAEAIGLEIYAPPMDIAPARIIMVWHRRSTRNPAHAWLRAQVAAQLAGLDE